MARQKPFTCCCGYELSGGRHWWGLNMPRNNCALKKSHMLTNKHTSILLHSLWDSVNNYSLDEWESKFVQLNLHLLFTKTLDDAICRDLTPANESTLWGSHSCLTQAPLNLGSPQAERLHWAAVICTGCLCLPHAGYAQQILLEPFSDVCISLCIHLLRPNTKGTDTTTWFSKQSRETDVTQTLHTVTITAFPTQQHSKLLTPL